MSEVKFFVTARGKDMIQYQYFLYYFLKENCPNVTVWDCVRKTTHRCKATVYLVDGKCSRLIGYHSHENEVKKIIAHEFSKSFTGVTLDKEDETLPELYEKFAAEYQKTIENIELPDFTSIKKIFFDKRSALRPKIPDDKTAYEEKNTECLSIQPQKDGETCPKRPKMSLEPQQGTTSDVLQQPKCFATYARQEFCNSESTAAIETASTLDSQAKVNPSLPPITSNSRTLLSGGRTDTSPGYHFLPSSLTMQQNTTFEESNRLTSYMPHSNDCETTGVESLVITDLRTIVSPVIQLGSTSPQNKTESELTSAPNTIKQDSSIEMDDGIIKPPGLLSSDQCLLDLSNKLLPNQSSSNQPDIQVQSDPTPEAKTGMQEKTSNVIEIIDVTSTNPPVSAGRHANCDEAVQPDNNRTLLSQPQREMPLLDSHSVSSEAPVHHKDTPLSAIDKTCSTITSQFSQRIPMVLGSKSIYPGNATIFNNTVQTINNVPYSPYMIQQHHVMPPTMMNYSVPNISAVQTSRMNPMSSSHIESQTNCITHPNTVQSYQNTNDTTFMPEANINKSSAMINKPECSSVLTNSATSQSPTDRTCSTNRILPNQGTCSYLTDLPVPSSALSLDVDQNKFSQNVPQGYGYQHPNFPGVIPFHQNGSFEAEAYAPLNRIPNYSAFGMKNPVGFEAPGYCQRNDRRALKASERDNLPAGPIILNAFSAKEISSPGLVRPKDRFDIYAEYLAEELRTIDPRTCAYIQKKVGDLLFEARSRGRFI